MDDFYKKDGSVRRYFMLNKEEISCGIESIYPITEILTPFFLRYGAKAFV